MLMGDLSMCNFDHTSYKNINIFFYEQGKTDRRDIDLLLRGSKNERLLNFVDWSPNYC